MSDEKCTANIMIRVSPGVLARVQAIAATTGIKPATLARMGLLELVERLGSKAPAVDPETAAMLETARLRGVDVRRVLADALEAKIAAESQTAA